MPWSRELLQTLIVAQIVRNSIPFMELHSSLTYCVHKSLPLFLSIRIKSALLQTIFKTQFYHPFKYLGSTLTDQNCIHEEIRSRLNSGNASFYAVQNILSSRLLSRNVKIKIYKTVILPVVCMGVKPCLSL
jgi:hypothetical protein